MVSPTIVPRSEHGISRRQIHGNALKVLYRLKDAGFEAYLVGGGVRDLLLGMEPKDFDIATEATPDEVRGLFRNCRLIGRRFRLAHIHFGRDIIEVATFRAPHEEAEGQHEAHTHEDGRILRDNVYGTLEQDVWRRDFSINALYYNIADFSVVDYVGGLEDLRAGRLRLIGDADVRYKEDPVRTLRAARFAAKLGFRLDEEAEKGLIENRHLLADAAPARLFDEFLKLMHGGYAVESFASLRHLGLFGYLFPLSDKRLDSEDGEHDGLLIRNALANTDRRINEGLPVNPAFLVAVMLWGEVAAARDQLLDKESPAIAMQIAGQAVIDRSVSTLAIPRRFSIVAREIWSLQGRLLNRSGKRPARLVTHPRFRAAYDFLCLRAQSGETELQEVCQWWTEYQENSPIDRDKMPRPSSGQGRKRRRPRRRKPSSAGKGTPSS